LFLLISIKFPESCRNYENILEEAAAAWTYKVAVLPVFFMKSFSSIQTRKQHKEHWGLQHIDTLS